MDDVIGNTTYIELASGETVTIEPLDGVEVLFVLPGKGAHLLEVRDALRIGEALVAAADPKDR